LISEKELNIIKLKVLQRAVDGLRKEGIKYNGILYAGMMLTPKDGPKTLEFNCRFGDPETQVILPLLESDLFEVLMATCTNDLKNISLRFKPNVSAVGVVMASKGYPETSTKGCVIEGIEKVQQQEEHLVFHSGTSLNSSNKWVTNGGRVLINVALAENLKTAAELATNACEIINFEGSQFRKDIAKKALKM
jgi:phosphoribosylamine--glycine ligase / phosphoribosylglycinamide formyltransferase / phosphoribosylformylglycinamidine cyclo-ligase